MKNKKTTDLVVICTKTNPARKLLAKLKRHKSAKLSVKFIYKLSDAYRYLLEKHPDIVLYDPLISGIKDFETFIDSTGQLNNTHFLPFLEDASKFQYVEGAHKSAIHRLVVGSKSVDEIAKTILEDYSKRDTNFARIRPNRQLIAMADQTPVMIWQCDNKGKFLFFNEAWLGFRGKTYRQEIKKGRESDVHADDAEHHQSSFKSALINRHCYKIEYRILKADGTYAWIMESASPHYNESGNFLGLIGTAVDITERINAETVSFSWQNRYRAAVHASGQLLMDWEPQTRRISFSGDLESFFGECVDEAPSNMSEWIEQIRSTQQSFFMEAMRKARFENRPFHIEYDIRLNGKGFKTIEHSAQAIRDKRGRITEVVGFITDVTSKKKTLRELRHRETRYRTLVSNIPGAVYRYARGKGDAWTVDYVSKEIQAITGYPKSYFTRNEVDAFTRMVLFDDRANRENLILKAMETHKPFVVNYRIREKNGEIRYLSEQGRFTKEDHDGNIWLDGVIFDVTERAKTEEKLNYIASHDPLTGLPNRMLMIDRLSQAVKKAQHGKEKLAVLFLDIDHFKRINDTLGHQIGDKILQMTAGRFKHVLFDLDTITRLGSDEFIVIASGIRETRHALKVADKLFNTFKTPFFIEGHELFMTASIGVAVYPDDAYDHETLLKNADTAMSRAKQQGRNNYQLYSPAMNDKALVRLKMENGLRKALDSNELRIHYQPFVDVKTGAITGMEALLRWHHAELGMVSPNDFIPIAEDTGLIIEIGEWVIEQVCDQVKQWELMGFHIVPVSINLSSCQFRRKEFVSRVSEIMHDTGINPRWIEFELTESTIMENVDDVISALNQFRSWGMQISVDDFGTGYSSLSRLKRFPINKLKIDRAFVRDIPSDPDDTAIAEAIISMAKNLSLSVVAEGVETEAQREFLEQKGCDTMQGFLFSRPLSATDFEAFFEESSKKFL